jgi:hypothetical protein
MHFSLLDAVPRSGIHRRKIIEFIRSLQEHPETQGDFTEKDVSLRERQIKIVGDYAVTYWLDAPVRIVMVVDVRAADK